MDIGTFFLSYGFNERSEMIQGKAGEVSEYHQSVEVVSLHCFSLSLHKVHSLARKGREMRQT